MIARGDVTAAVHILDCLGVFSQWEMQSFARLAAAYLALPCPTPDAEYRYRVELQLWRAQRSRERLEQAK
jgi:hypothetical protein